MTSDTDLERAAIEAVAKWNDAENVTLYDLFKDGVAYERERLGKALTTFEAECHEQCRNDADRERISMALKGLRGFLRDNNLLEPTE